MFVNNPLVSYQFVGCQNSAHRGGVVLVCLTLRNKIVQLFILYTGGHHRAESQ